MDFGGGGDGFYEKPAAQTGGGGFYSSQQDVSGSQEQAASKPRVRRDQQTLTPCTISQIHGAGQDNPDDSFMIDGHEISQVKVVGCIVEKKVQSTNVAYTIEDGTGRIEVKCWADPEESEYSAAEVAKLTEGRYVRVVGNVKSFQERYNIVGFNIRLVEDYNEITHHMLESIWVHAGRTGMTKKSRPGMTGMATSSTALKTESFGGGKDDDEFTPVQRAVLDVFKDCKLDSGMDIRNVIQNLITRGITHEEVRNAVGFLSDEGHLYSTIDEDHFKCTAA